MKKRLVFGVCVLLLQGLGGSVAFASAPSAGTCAGGSIAAGTYNSLTVTGNCTFAGGTVTIDGNLRVADGAVLNDHAASTATVYVTGNVIVGTGAILGLGSYNPFAPNGTTVDGNIIANQPLSLYLGEMTVRGNVVSSGGGSGPSGEFRNFPIKDDVIGGNLIVQGWQGGWIGLIRDQVGGNVIFSNNASVLTEAGPGIDSDSSEVMTNIISGNLICQGNSPAAQVNPDDGGQPNTVAGHKIGQCAGL
jgi:hypothetical protein